ncbi:protein-disulfide reductase DsbD family protein [Algoriphagus marincola]|uniref:protein-disulfide reductase DsbD family protein n=1 Tax=Algoriphagus marincola TaxID=264027 RepID=UPI0004066B6D|nr:cytochrome c biogenesis protein CcdA [Algoriphagus marincola]
MNQFSIWLKSILLVGLFSVSFLAKAQIISPPEWTVSVSPAQPNAGEEAVLRLEAKIPIGWYIYGTGFDPDLGPLVTTLIMEDSESFDRIGSLQEVDAKEKYDEIWEGDITYFMGSGLFEQKILAKKSGTIQGVLEYQMCSDLTGQCINYEEDISISLTVPGGEILSPENASESTSVQEEDSDATDSSQNASDLFNSVDSGESSGIEDSEVQVSFEPEGDVEESLWGFMILAFLAGLAALVTPCVFPMIPMTVSFFTGRAKSKAAGIRNGFIYGLSIIGIYTIAGTAVAAIQGPEFANWLATHWLPNLFFFGIFIFFALAFLGLFEITLPSGFVNKMDAKSEKGGLIGIFFMAFTLVLVSFSCTGPIVGSILISSAGGELIKPVLGMFSFSLAFAIPFTLFAVFPGWMSSLPKSGGWLNSVKVVLGFLELALAFKFLSIADQVYHWGILDRDVFLVIHIVIFFALGLYLLGKIRLPHDSPLEHLGVPKLLLALFSWMIALYMIPGLWGAPLKYLSGYLPPLTSQQFKVGGSVAVADDAGYALDESVKYADLLEIPHGIKGYFDYDQALRAAKAADKPLLIDFTGHGCVNCRKMEENVWVDPEVLRRLKEDFVMVALYIDERLELPETEWYTSEYDGKVKKTLGKQNADFQITRFQNNAQPYYVILDHDEELITKPRAYDTDVQAFVEFLVGAKKEFERRK